MRVIHLHCPQCGYDLRGHRSVTCPECGTPVDRRRIVDLLRLKRLRPGMVGLQMFVPSLIAAAFSLPMIIISLLLTDPNVGQSLLSCAAFGFFIGFIVSLGRSSELAARAKEVLVIIEGRSMAETGIGCLLFAGTFLLQLFILFLAMNVLVAIAHVSSRL
ncbi:MAG: hypothetical protein WD768_17370 [Phycisphaeraceae bacterium]